MNSSFQGKSTSSDKAEGRVDLGSAMNNKCSRDVFESSDPSGNRLENKLRLKPAMDTRATQSSRDIFASWLLSAFPSATDLLSTASAAAEITNISSFRSSNPSGDRVEDKLQSESDMNTETPRSSGDAFEKWLLSAFPSATDLLNTVSPSAEVNKITSFQGSNLSGDRVEDKLRLESATDKETHQSSGDIFESWLFSAFPSATDLLNAILTTTESHEISSFGSRNRSSDMVEDTLRLESDMNTETPQSSGDIFEGWLLSAFPSATDLLNEVSPSAKINKISSFQSSNPSGDRFEHKLRLESAINKETTQSSSDIFATWLLPAFPSATDLLNAVSASADINKISSFRNSNPSCDRFEGKLRSESDMNAEAPRSSGDILESWLLSAFPSATYLPDAVSASTEISKISSFRSSNPSGDRVEHKLRLESAINKESPHLLRATPDDSLAGSWLLPALPSAKNLLFSVEACAEMEKINEFAAAAMEELWKMAFEGEPLWNCQDEGGILSLDESAYLQEFGVLDPVEKGTRRILHKGSSGCLLDFNAYIDKNRYQRVLMREVKNEDFHTEASRETAYVRTNATCLIKLFMDVGQWAQWFSDIVSNAENLAMLSVGQPNVYDGMLELVTAKFHASAPLVCSPTSYFARYSKKLNSRTWGVVDASLEGLCYNQPIKYIRRPTGCIIEEMPNGFSKVTWVEHAKVGISLVHHFKQSVTNYSYVFNAKRWIAAIIRCFENHTAS